MSLEKLLAHLPLEKPLVLVDLGASVLTPPVWRALQPYAHYIGFDPDAEHTTHVAREAFQKATLLHYAIGATAGEAQFYELAYHQSSSLLRPTDWAQDYHFAHYFEIKRVTPVTVKTLDEALGETGIKRVHWLKTDVQGMDYAVYASLSPSLRAGLLAYDVELGLSALYEGEVPFGTAHERVLADGFWLAQLQPQGGWRLGPKARQWLKTNPDLPWDIVERSTPRTPSWVDARYLRTLASLAAQRAPQSDYVLLWVASVLSAQYGYALDVALTIDDAHLTPLLLRATRDAMTAVYRRVYRFSWRGWLPFGVKHALRRLLRRG